MHFALGKAYEDISDYKKSFNHYKQGNDFKTFHIQNIKLKIL